MRKHSSISKPSLRKALYGSANSVAVTCMVLSRRLEDRIRELCAKVVATEENNLEATIAELRAALREHTARLRRMAAAKLSDPVPCRRRPSV